MEDDAEFLKESIESAAEILTNVEGEAAQFSYSEKEVISVAVILWKQRKESEAMQDFMEQMGEPFGMGDDDGNPFKKDDDDYFR